MHRFVMPALAPLLLAFTVACSGAVSSATPVTPVIPPGFLTGGDVSALTRIEQGGAAFSTGTGGPVSAIAALRSRGANIFRLRLFLAPNGEEVQVNDLAYTLALAKRVKASGAALMLDLHYSDTWADPQHQVIPAAWRSLDFPALERQVEEYTAEVLTAFRTAQVMPAIVEVGNEIDNGLLWPHGRIAGPTTTDTTAAARFGRLLKAGVRGVRRVTTPADSVRVMLHFSQSATPALVQAFFDLVEAQGVSYDLVGLSYYPWWHGTLAGLQQSLAMAAQRYGKDILVTETAYPWRAGWTPEGTHPEAMTWPLTADGQRAFLRDVINAVASTPGGHGLGVLWWYPEAVQVPGLFVWGGGALALFDEGGRTLPATLELTRPSSSR